MDETDESIYILNADAFVTPDDNLLIADDYLRSSRRHMLPLDDLQDLETDKGNIVDDFASDSIGFLSSPIKMRPISDLIIKNEEESPVSSSSLDLSPTMQNFLLPYDHQTFKAKDTKTTTPASPPTVEPKRKAPVDTVIEHMDVRSPVKILKELLERKLFMDFSKHEIWLQNAQKLNAEKNLVGQCVQGAGWVQVNMELCVIDGEKRINIVDVLKPTEEFLRKQQKSPKLLTQSGFRWEEDSLFRGNIMKQLDFPRSVALWTKDHVGVWIKWAVKKFKLSGLRMSDWKITGKELCEMAPETFQQIVGVPACDPHGIFYTHFELLRKCNLIAVVSENDTTASQVLDFDNGNEADGELDHGVCLELEREIKQEREDGMETEVEQSLDPPPDDASPVSLQGQVVLVTDGTRIRVPSSSPKQPREAVTKKSRILGSSQTVSERRIVMSTKSGVTGMNGQITLWQFLLELLTDMNHQNAIYFISSDGEFKLQDPEVVAQLWGVRKNKPAMTYEKMSRALRYYYDGDMIAKVPGKRFVYKFVCDLKELLGYSPAELGLLVSSCAKKHNLPHFNPDNFNHSE